MPAHRTRQALQHRNLAADRPAQSPASATPAIPIIDLSQSDEEGHQIIGQRADSTLKRFHTPVVHNFIKETLARKASEVGKGFIRKRIKIGDLPSDGLVRRHAWVGAPAIIGGRRYFEAMVLDGIRYSVNDAVAIPTKQDGVKLGLLRSLSEDTRPNDPKNKRRKMAHVHWLMDSALGAPNEVFLAEGSCDDVPLCKLSRKVAIRLGPARTPSRDMFYRFVYDEPRLVLRDPAIGLGPEGHCDACHANARSQVQRPSPIDLKSFGKTELLPAMDFYAGGGGTMTGARDLFQGKWAVDIDPSCCDTLQHNHPNTQVFCQSLGALRQQAMRLDAGRVAQPLYDLRDSHKVLPRLPRKGDVVMLTACPPCQGHTGINANKKSDDRRNEELFGTLSEVDRLQPDFFLLENVAGFKTDRHDGVFKDDSEIRNFAQITLMGLIRIGYQCRLAILDSRAYGSPQNRVRVFVLAARAGLTLPSFPSPTHENPRHRHMSMGDGWLGPDFPVGKRLQPAVSVRDAISDLPAFGYQSAHTASGPSLNRSMPVFNARLGPRGKVGFVDQVVYASAPLHPYQALKRRGRTQVTQHFTPGATEAQLTIILSHPPMLGDRTSAVEGSARRANPGQGFPTLLTTSRPGGKATGVIHYEQNRTFTVRERARAQGFPDSYTFIGDTAAMDSMTGNAVNVDIAAAIYRSIVMEGILPWWISAGKPQGNLFERWRADHPV